MDTPVCPLCGGTKKMKNAKPLYNTPVCRKCYYSFANRRQLAYVVDWVLYTVASLGVGFVLGMGLALVGASDDQIQNAGLAVGWLVLPMFFFCKDGFSGYSPGKLVTRVRAVDRDTHEPIGFLRSFKRNLILLVPLMPLIVAYLLQKGHRVGDGWAGSKVIWLRHAGHPVFTGRMTCAGCGYDLRGLTSGVCPECGIAVPALGPAAPPTAPAAPPSR